MFLSFLFGTITAQDVIGPNLLSRSADGLKNFHFVDIDGDDVKDWVYTRANTIGYNGSLVWLRGSEGTNFDFEENFIDEISLNQTTTYITDVDNDEDIDIISIRHSTGRAVVYANDGSGNFASELELFDSDIYFNYTRLVDLNDDGHLDIYFEDISEGIHGYYPNDGNFQFPSEIILLDEDSYFIRRSAFFDVDGDGDSDWVQSRNSDQIVIQFQTTNGVFSSTDYVVDGDVGLVFYMKYRDLDGDGEKDMVYFSQSGDFIRWARGLGFGDFDTPVTLLEIEGLRNFELFDMDQDGDLEICYSVNSFYEVYWIENVDGTSFGGQQVLGHVTSTVNEFTFLDYNDDELDDIVGRSSDTGQVVLLSKHGRRHGIYLSNARIF